MRVTVLGTGSHNGRPSTWANGFALCHLKTTEERGSVTGGGATKARREAGRLGHRIAPAQAKVLASVPRAGGWPHGARTRVADPGEPVSDARDPRGRVHARSRAVDQAVRSGRRVGGCAACRWSRRAFQRLRTELASGGREQYASLCDVGGDVWVWHCDRRCVPCRGRAGGPVAVWVMSERPQRCLDLSRMKTMACPLRDSARMVPGFGTSQVLCRPGRRQRRKNRSTGCPGCDPDGW
jgi:hypothetical protein